jgi:phosphatidylserine/phosphatidylglycerophosphate/cardiolipin synthase-like enzyme
MDKYWTLLAQRHPEHRSEMRKTKTTKGLSVLTALIALSLFVLLGVSQSKEIILNNTPVQVYFSPHGGCTQAIVRTINQAKREILVQAYSFTSKPIAKALVEAHKRGVKTEIILDKSQRREKYSAADFTAHMGIPTYIDAVHGIAHNKVMIIDGKIVITGSFNFTRAAEERNAENLLIIQSQDLAREYTKNWNQHKEHSEIYEGR